MVKFSNKTLHDWNKLAESELKKNNDSEKKLSSES